MQAVIIGVVSRRRSSKCKIASRPDCLSSYESRFHRQRSDSCFSPYRLIRTDRQLLTCPDSLMRHMSANPSQLVGESSSFRQVR